jgi:RNA polymerase sigma factor (sigma-70 family)
MNASLLFESNLELIDRVIAGVCSRARVFGADAEDLASDVKLALIENDYAILRPFEGRSSLSTFLVVIVHRFLIDQWTKRTGRWHPSREAERMGEAGVALEQIVRREQRSIDEALPIVQNLDPTLTRERIVAMESRLPARVPRQHPVALESAEGRLAAVERADDRIRSLDVERLSDRTGRVICETLESMSVEDRMIVRFHFGSSMTIADISGLLRLPQRPLYRRLESLLQRFRRALIAEGIDARAVADLIGQVTRELDFGLTNGTSGKSGPVRRTNAHESPHGVEEAG